MTGEKNMLEGLNANSLARFPKHNATTAHCNKGTLSPGFGKNLCQNRVYGDELERDDAVDGDQEVVFEGCCIHSYISATLFKMLHPQNDTSLYSISQTILKGYAAIHEENRKPNAMLSQAAI